MPPEPLQTTQDRAESPSSRQYDMNNFILVRGNPISKSGVFQYRGSQIRSENNPPSMDLDPNKIYNVLRPAEELMSPDCVESFKLLPFVDEHAMLGPAQEGLTPAERKGVAGVIGEEVYYEAPYLRGNLKIFSDKMSEDIDNGKKEVSAGYRCRYEIISGTHNGEHYDAIQRDIRGNHVALVPEGRCGPDVSVLDHMKIVFDAKEFGLMDPTTKAALDALTASVQSLASGFKTVTDSVESMQKKLDAKDEDTERKEGEDEAEEEEKKKQEEAKKKVGEDSELEKKKEEDREKAMDAAIQKGVEAGVTKKLADLAQARTLASKLIPHIGAFDHTDKPLKDVAKYGIEKLGLKNVADGHEVTAIEAHLQGKEAQGRSFTVTLDGGVDATKDKGLDSYLTGASA